MERRGRDPVMYIMLMLILTLILIGMLIWMLTWIQILMQASNNEVVTLCIYAYAGTAKVRRTALARTGAAVIRSTPQKEKSDKMIINRYKIMIK